MALTVCVVAAASCGADSTLPASGLSGTYRLVTVDGQAVPFSAAARCGSPCILESGSLTVTTGDTVFFRETITSPPSDGLPGTTGTAVGHYILRRVGDRFAMEPGPDITLGRAVDTLFVKGDSLALRATAPVGSYGVRTYTR